MLIKFSIFIKNLSEKIPFYLKDLKVRTTHSPYVTPRKRIFNAHTAQVIDSSSKNEAELPTPTIIQDDQDI